MPLSEPVLTPTGFVPMGDMAVGTILRTPDNGTAEVIQIHPQGIVKTYRIRFVDGAETICTGEHLWLSWIARVRLSEKVRTTTEIIRILAETKQNVIIPLTNAISFDKAAHLTIKPYTLGVLLGDGCTLADVITISNPDVEVFDRVKSDGYVLKQYYRTRKDRTLTYALKEFSSEKKWLRDQGLLCHSYEKRIPEEYKYAPIDDRIAIVQGLMDTDGYADERGHVSYSSTSKQLSEDLQWIIRSLGGKATITEKVPVCTLPSGEKKECRTSYTVYIQTSDNSALFSLPRKKNRCVGKMYNGGNSRLGRRIVSIEENGYENCQCITLNDGKGLYITRDFIVTHNSFGLLLNALRYKNVPGFGCTVFRKNFNQIFAQGGLWDDSVKIYSGIAGAVPKWSRGTWLFYNSEGELTSKVSFAHIERDLDVHKWQGSQIPMIAFDELNHFSEYTFFYMMSRNRSTCGVRPTIKATCNPDADSWVAKFIEWWVDQETGYPIPERSGKIRWFVRRDGKIFWANHKETLWKKFNMVTDEEKEEPRSVTFIMSSVYDNRELLKVNPQYLSSLKALPEVEKERLLYGNWKIKAAAGLFFKRSQVTLLETSPTDLQYVCRAWDLAATEDKGNSGDPDFTSGVLIGKRKSGTFVVLNVINERIKAGEVENLIYNTSVSDRAKYGFKCKIRIPQDPGAAGKIVANNYIKKLSGFPVKAIPVTGSKQLRATPFAAQWQNGNVEVVAADWNEAYFVQLESFPESKHDDMVDASSDAFNEVAEPSFSLKNMV